MKPWILNLQQNQCNINVDTASTGQSTLKVGSSCFGDGQTRRAVRLPDGGGSVDWAYLLELQRDFDETFGIPQAMRILHASQVARVSAPRWTTHKIR